MKSDSVPAKRVGKKAKFIPFELRKGAVPSHYEQLAADPHLVQVIPQIKKQQDQLDLLLSHFIVIFLLNLLS